MKMILFLSTIAIVMIKKMIIKIMIIVVTKVKMHQETQKMPIMITIIVEIIIKAITILLSR